MSRMIEETINNPVILADYKKMPGYNLVKVQTVTDSSYLGYIKDTDEEGSCSNHCSMNFILIIFSRATSRR